MNRKYYLLLLVFLWSHLIFGQTPVINSVTPIATYPGNKVLITGAGFSNTPAQLKVWFDHVPGTITASSAFSIEVTLPPQARLSNGEVLNLTTGLSAKSSLKVVPTFGGGAFDPSKIGPPVSFGASPTPTDIFDVCSCDLDGDGKPDLAGSQQGVGTDILILRNTSVLGTISFVATSVGVTAPTFNLACGDLNGDGKPDLIASRSSTNEIFVLRNTSSVGSITFAPKTILFMDDVLHRPFRLSIRDLNMDGKPEIIATNSADDIATNDNIIYVFVNQSSGGTLTFAASTVKLTVTNANTSYGLDVQDIDGDSKPEIIVNQFTSNHIFVLRNTSTSSVSFAPSQQITLLATLNQLTTADFNEDGKLDIAATSSFDNKAFVLLNQSTPGSIAFGSAINLTTGTFPWGIDAADADGDGDIDILVGNRGVGVVDMTLMKSNGNNGALAFTPVSISVGKKSRNVRVGDYDGDGKPDFGFTTDSGNSLDVIRNLNCFVPTILNSSPLTICIGQTIRLNAIPGLGVTDYDWKKNGVTVTNGLNDYLNLMSNGNYTVTATSETGSCVQVSNTIVITVGSGTLPTDPLISSNSPLCSVPGQNLQLNGPTVASVTYIWTGPNGFSSNLEDPQILNVTSANAGDYSLQLSNGTCFSNVSTTRVDIANLQNFSVSSSVPSNTICQSANLTLTVNVQTGYTYQWIKDGIDMPGQTSTSLLVTLEGAYTARVTNTALSCSLITSPATNVVVLTAPGAGFNVNATSCVGVALTFTDQSTKDSRATAVYAWNFGDAGTSSTASPTHTYATANTFTPGLTLSYSGVSGCSSSNSKNIVITASPAVTATANKTSLSAGESAQLLAAGAATYSWTPTLGLSDPAIANPVATPSATTLYTVVGTVSGCTGSATITIDVVPVPPTTLNIPNVFSPNGDSFNDEWIIMTLDANCTIAVFDKAGHKIIEQRGSPVTWNGTYNGSPAPDGTYFYVVSCPNSEPRSGHVLLAR